MEIQGHHVQVGRGMTKSTVGASLMVQVTGKFVRASCTRRHRFDLDHGGVGVSWFWLNEGSAG
jgi:hypothetical protein